MSYSVSGRKILPEMNIADYIRIFYIYTDFAAVESIFGHLDRRSGLYGGRPFTPEHSLTRRHLRQIKDLGINLSLTLTNHYFDEKAYQAGKTLLKSHHHKGNSIICVNDDLARRVKNDFPDYLVKASIIKNLDTLEKIEMALPIYDQVVLPMEKNDDDAFLLSIPEENRLRVVLFGNATCAYTCPDRTCYLGFSRQNAGHPDTMTCSKKRIQRLDLGDVFFNIKKLKKMGYSHYKLVPLAPASATGAALRIRKPKENGKG
ncbi:MAG: hypothetical protein MI863_20190 [Desulfobacterales bacterium]|nr:hypothetical protein [Desulfobacterales bacterium]